MEWIQMIISLIGVIGLILFMFYFLRKFNKAKAVINGNKLRIIDRANLGRDSMLLVVCVCGKLMLLGVSAGRVDKICDLDMSEEDYVGTSSDLQKPLAFSDVLSNITNGRLNAHRNVKEGKEDAFEADDTASDDPK